MIRILVVDDQPDDAALAVQLLEEAGEWRTEQVATAAAGLQRFADGSYDLVLTDLHMPGMAGLEFMQEIHRLSPIQPVVVMTSRGNERKAVKALDAGAASYLPKSRLESDLVATCRRVLDSAAQVRDQATLLDHLVAERFTLNIDNDRRHLPALIDLLLDRCMQFGVVERGEYPRIGVAIEEAMLNAMVHGNLEVNSDLREESHQKYEEVIAQRLAQSPFRDRRVTISASLSRTECRITIRDEGPGFNPDELRDPTEPENLNRVSGRGILLMRAFLSDVSYNQRGNEVTLVICKPTTRCRPIAETGTRSAVSHVC